MPLQRFALGAALLVVLAIARITATYPVFNQTFDEPAHIASGLEWLDLGQYHYEHQHPPLARVAVALGLYLAGERSLGNRTVWAEGNQLLYSGGHYFRNLALARVGILPFFVIACAVVGLWTRRLFGNRAALAATLAFTMLPPVLAHSGLATTDMACAAFTFAALYAWSRWLERPGWPETALLGAAAALAALSKFSSLIFLPASGGAILVLYWAIERPGPAALQDRTPRRAITLFCAIVAACFIIWAGYRFSTGRINPEIRPDESIDKYVADVTLPAWEFFDGIAEVEWHSTRGHESWLLGEYRTDGWWYFFPVVLAVKTPLPFLLLCAVGFYCLARRSRRKLEWQPWAPGMAALMVLAVCLPSSINLGVRHILPIYPLLAIFAGLGLAHLFRDFQARRPATIAGAALALWLVAGSLLAHPDYLAYFNEIASSKPEYFLAESDLDWGQDLQRLSDTLHDLGVQEVHLGYFGTADPTRHHLPPIKGLSIYHRDTGWVAVSIRYLTIGAAMLREQRGGNPLAWLKEEKPVLRVGKSINLYHLRE